MPSSLNQRALASSQLAFGGDLLHRAETAQREAEVRVVEGVRCIDAGLLLEQAGESASCGSDGLRSSMRLPA